MFLVISDALLVSRDGLLSLMESSHGVRDYLSQVGALDIWGYHGLSLAEVG